MGRTGDTVTDAAQMRSPDSVALPTSLKIDQISLAHISLVLATFLGHNYTTIGKMETFC